MVDSNGKLKHFYGKEYASQLEKNTAARRRINLIENIKLPKYYTVADFGCGNGMLMNCLCSKVKSYYGVDFDKFSIETAKKRRSQLKITNAEFFCESIESFCVRCPEMFDAIFFFDVAEHIADEELSGIIKAIRQTMKPEAKLYLHTPNADFFVEAMKKKNFILRQFKEHVAVRNAEEIIDLLEQAGFCKYEIKLIPHYNFLRVLHILSFLPFIGKYFKARIFIIAEK